MNYSQEERANYKSEAIDLALEKLFENVLECIITDEKILSL